MSARSQAADERKRNRWAAIIGSALAILTLLLVAWLLLVLPATKRFDPVKWRESPMQRWQMIDDLDSSGVLLGKSSSQVRQLLGEPEAVEAGIQTYPLGRGHFLRVIPGADDRVRELYVEWD